MRYPLHRAVLLVCLFGLIGSVFSAAKPAEAAPEFSAPSRYFEQTGHNVSGAIRGFYEANGDLQVFGLPLTEVIKYDGMEVQYFERARFELHPELPSRYYVSLTQLGRNLVAGRTEASFAPTAATGEGSFFKETGHNVAGAFLNFWSKRGGLPVFGYPLSEIFDEASPTDGVVRQVQYFERARFEFHPEERAAYQVQLGLLGRQAIDASEVPAAARKPAAPIGLLGTATTVYYGSISERVNNIANGAARMNGIVVQPGQVFSFNALLGDAGKEDGFVEGYAIVNGRLEKVIGGGICQVSTTLYRAVFNAGLEIVERRNHSYVINFYENVAGWDATVFSPYVDFKWRNDTPYPITIATSTNPNKATVTFSLYGVSDGRTAKMIGPTVTNVKKQGIPNWQYDPKLKRGAVLQLVHGRPGMNVAMKRVVTGANGKVIHNDNLPSRYLPWEDFYTYGPGVNPPKGVHIVPATTKAAAPARP